MAKSFSFYSKMQHFPTSCVLFCRKSTDEGESHVDDMKMKSPESKKQREGKNLTATEALHRKWSVKNKVMKRTCFIHRSKIKHCEIGGGAARIISDAHKNRIKFQRVSDPYGDFSPLIVTLLPEDNPSLDFTDIEKLRNVLPRLLQHEVATLFGGSEERVAKKSLSFRVFGHQHLYQGSFEAYDLLEHNPEKQAALEYFQAHVYIGMPYEELEALGNFHNKISHNDKKRDATEIIRSLRRGWIEAGRPMKTSAHDKVRFCLEVEMFTDIKCFVLRLRLF